MTVMTSLSLYEFEDQFRKMNRNNFSSEGYEYLYDVLDEGNIDLDVVAVCCDWTEYEDFKSLYADYGYLLDDEYDDEDELEEALCDRLNDETWFAPLSCGSYLVHIF